MMWKCLLLLQQFKSLTVSCQKKTIDLVSPLLCPQRSVIQGCKLVNCCQNGHGFCWWHASRVWYCLHFCPAFILNVLDPLDYTPPDSERADQMSNAIIAAPEKLVVSYCGITQCECTQQNLRNSSKPHVFNALFLSGPCGPLATNRKLGTLGWQWKRGALGSDD